MTSKNGAFYLTPPAASTPAAASTPPAASTSVVVVGRPRSPLERQVPSSTLEPEDTTAKDSKPHIGEYLPELFLHA